MRSLTALSAFLDVSSLNLAVPQGAAIFFAHASDQTPSSRAGASDTTVSITCAMWAWSRSNRGSRSIAPDYFSDWRTLTESLNADTTKRDATC